MNKMIIDVEYLKKLSKELEVNNSSRLLNVKKSIEEGLKLDYRIINKLCGQNTLLENINNIIYTNKTLHGSVEKAIGCFAILESLKSGVTIEDFILLTNTALDAQTSLLNMFGDQMNTLEGINSLIEQMEANINAMTSPDSWYEFQDAEVLLSYLLDSYVYTNTTGQMEYDSYNNSIKISGFLLSNIIDYMKSEQQKLNAYVQDFYEHKENNTSMNISDFQNKYPEYMNSFKTNDNIHVDFSTILEDTNILEELSKLNKELEKLSLYSDNLERLKSNKVIFQSMVYNIRMTQMIKPFEDVIGNSDFAELSVYDKEGYTITDPNDIDMYIKIFGKYDDAIIDDEIDEKGNYIALRISIEKLKEKYLSERNRLLNEDLYSNGFKEYSVEDGIRLDFFTDLVNKATINSNDEYLTDMQKQIYWYHYNKFGEAKALDYIEALKDSINDKKGLKMTYEYLDYLAQNGLSFGDNISLFFKGTIDGIGNTFDGIANIFAADGIRSETDYAKLYLLQILDSSTYTEENLTNMIEKTNASISEINQFRNLVELSNRLGEGFWRDLSTHSYQVGSSVGYMTLPVLLNLMLPGAGSTLLFASTLGNSVEQSYQTLGSLSWKSYAYGALTALSEVLMEHLGGLPGFGDPSKSFLSSILSEGMQEFFQTFITGALDSAMFKTEYNITELSKEAVQAAIYGVITAGIMQGTMKPITLIYLNSEGLIVREEMQHSDALLFLEQKLVVETPIDAELRRTKAEQNLNKLRAQMDKYKLIMLNIDSSFSGEDVAADFFHYIHSIIEMPNEKNITMEHFERNALEIAMFLKQFTVEELYDSIKLIKELANSENKTTGLNSEDSISYKEMLQPYYYNFLLNLLEQETQYKVDTIYDLFEDNKFRAYSMPYENIPGVEVSVDFLIDILNNDSKFEGFKNRNNRYKDHYNDYLAAFDHFYTKIIEQNITLPEKTIERLKFLSEKYDSDKKVMFQVYNEAETLFDQNQESSIPFSDVNSKLKILIDQKWMNSNFKSAQKIINIFNSLPNILKENIENIVFTTLESPVSPYWQFVFSDPKHEGVASADYRTGEITFYNYFKNSRFFKSFIFETAYHEAAHLFSHKYNVGNSIEWKNAVEADVSIKSNLYPSDYARTSFEEDWAESVAHYYLNPKLFEKKYPNRYKIINKYLIGK